MPEKVVNRRTTAVLVDNMIQEQSMRRRRLSSIAAVFLIPDPSDPFDFFPLFTNTNQRADNIANHII